MANSLEELRQQIDNLKAERARLEAIKNAKLESIKLKLGNIPRSFAAQHPVVSTVGAGLGKAGLATGKAIGRGIKKLATADLSGDTSRMSNLEYMNWLARRLSAQPKSIVKPTPKPKKHIYKHKHTATKSLDQMKAELAKLKVENQLKKTKKEALAYA